MLDRRTFFLPLAGLLGFFRARPIDVAAATRPQPKGPQEQIRQAWADAAPRVLEPGEVVTLVTQQGNATGRVLERGNLEGRWFRYRILVTTRADSEMTRPRPRSSMALNLAPGIVLHELHTGVQNEKIAMFMPSRELVLMVESERGSEAVILEEVSTVVAEGSRGRIVFKDGIELRVPLDESRRVAETIDAYRHIEFGDRSSPASV